MGTLWGEAAHAELIPVNTTEQPLGTVSFVPTDSVLSPVAAATEYSLRQSVLFWVDSRPGDSRAMTTMIVSSPPDVQCSLYAARFDVKGEPLDPGGRLVGRYLSNPTSLRVAGSWGGYTAVWSESGEIFGAFVSATGSPKEPIAYDSVTQLSGSDGRQHSPDIGCNNYTCIVTWVDESSASPRLVAHRVTPSLEIRTEIALPAPASGSVRLEPKVILPMSETSTYREVPAVLLWREAATFPSGVYAVRIASDNSIEDLAPIALLSAPMVEGSMIAAGASKQGVCLVWETSSGNGDIHASLFDRDLTPSASDVTVAAGTAVQTAARVAVDPTGSPLRGRNRLRRVTQSERVRSLPTELWAAL